MTLCEISSLTIF